MDADKQNKYARKRRRPGGSDANNTSESALSDDTGNKHYAIRSRRTQTKAASDDTPGIQSSNEKEGPSPSNSPAVTTSTDTEHTTPKTTTTTASPLQQATRELHARIMSRVRDLAPSFKPPPMTPAPTPKENPETTPNTAPSSPTNIETKDRTRTVKELQHLISQYLQQQRANLGLASPATSPTSIPNSTPSPISTPRTSPTITSIPNVVNVNILRTPTDINNQRGISNDNTLKSSIIANKFSNAITKYARSPNVPNSTGTSSSTSNFASHPTTTPHYAANGNKPFNQAIGTGHEGGPAAAHSVASFTRPVTSVLDKNVPSLSIQYKHNQKEKRRKTEYGYYDDASSNSSEGNTNSFLQAALHELQNMDEELASLEKQEMLENEIERLQRGIAMRDRVIRKLHDDIEEKDAVSLSIF